MAQLWARPFYNSHEWIQVREGIMMRDKYTCQRCHRPAQEVHHKQHLSPDNIWDTNITLNPDNLVALCRDCHFRQHEEDSGRGQATGKGFRFDENGQLVPDGDEKIF